MGSTVATSLMDGWSSTDPGGLRVWSHPGYGRFVCGLFYLYDTEGLPLAVSMDMASEHGLRLCPMQERACAIAQGWTPERFDRWWAEGLADMTKEVEHG